MLVLVLCAGSTSNGAIMPACYSELTAQYKDGAQGEGAKINMGAQQSNDVESYPYYVGKVIILVLVNGQARCPVARECLADKGFLSCFVCFWNP